MEEVIENSGVNDTKYRSVHEVFSKIRSGKKPQEIIFNKEYAEVRDDVGNNIFHIAAEADEKDVLQYVFTNYPKIAYELLNEQNKDEKTPIQIATDEQSIEAQLFFINQDGVEISGIKINSVDDALNYIIEITRLLFNEISNNAPLEDIISVINTRESLNARIYGENVLHAAVYGGNIEFVTWHLRQYPESKRWFERDANELTPYDKAAAIWGEKSNIAKLIKAQESYSILINSLKNNELEEFKLLYKKCKVNLNEKLKQQIDCLAMDCSITSGDNDLLTMIIQGIDDLCQLKVVRGDYSPLEIAVITGAISVFDTIFDLVIKLSDKSKSSPKTFEIKDVLIKLFRIEKKDEALSLNLFAEQGNVEFFNLIFTKFDYETITKLLSMQDVKLQTAMHVLAENIHKSEVYEIFDWILQSLPKACIKNLFLKRNIEGQSPYNVLKYMESDNGVKILEAINDYGINLETTGGGFFYNHENEY